MLSTTFPDPREYEFPEWLLFGEYYYRASDIVSVGQTLTLANVREAYLKGIFPWHVDGMPLPWYCPERRAVLEFSELHIPKSLEKEWRKGRFTFSIDKCFSDVIEQCSLAKRSRGMGGTWITADFIRVYGELHREGMAHSVEVWDADRQLAGGLYGVDAGGVFCGESMFFKVPNASKLALLFLVDHLIARGATWLDAQVMTPHLEALGAKEIDRREFLDKLKET